MRSLVGRLVAWFMSAETLNCHECGKLCHRHEPGCEVPPGEVGTRRD